MMRLLPELTTQLTMSMIIRVEEQILLNSLAVKKIDVTLTSE